MASNTERIKKLSEELKGLEERASSLEGILQSNSDNIDSITQKRTEAQGLLQEIQNLSIEMKSLNTELSDLGEDAKESHEAIKNLENEAQVKKEQLDKAEISIFGEKDEETEQRSGGLVDRLESLESQTKEQLKSHGQDFDQLKEKIEGLLPGATSAGLATAFKKQKESYRKPNQFWQITLILSLVAIIAVSFFTPYNMDSWSAIAVSFFARSPFIGPLVWLAWFSGKEFSQNKRLEQEYAHKEVLAKSLEGYKKELAGADPLVTKAFLEGIVKSLIFNPSITLEKKTDDSYPPILNDAQKKSKISCPKETKK